jgi:hypothetical protein
MTLPKEWQQEADRIIVKHGFHEPLNDLAISTVKPIALDLATAYKQAVEKAVNEKIGHLEEFIKTVKDMHLNGLITAAKTELYLLLDTLQTLTPTSND